MSIAAIPRNGSGKRAEKTPDHITMKRLRCCREEFIAKCRKAYLAGVPLEAKLDKAGIEWGDLPRTVQIMVMEEKAQKASVKLEMEMPVWAYKELCAGAVVHGLADWKAMLVEYLRCTITEWQNNGYFIDP